MKDSLKKLNDTTKAALIATIASKAVEALIATTKSASDSDSGTFKIVVSTSDVDRQGESVNQNGWDLTFFKANPIVLWAHDYSSLPIGMCTDIGVKDGKLVAEGKFAPAEANPFAQQVRKLYDLGMVNTTSVGFIPKEYDEKSQGVISKSELLEFSFVPVPANPYALRLNQIKELSLDTSILRMKGIDIKEEADAIVTPPAEVVTPTAEPVKPAEAVEPVKPAETPVEPAKPAETAPDGEKGAKKGDVSTELDAVEQRQQKWQKYGELCEAFDAFCTVYFDDATAVDDFGKHATELSQIIAQIASANGVDADAGMEKMIAGKTLISLHKSIMVALGSTKLSEGGKNGKEIVPVSQRSKTAGALKEVNSFVETQELLRLSATAMGKALENFNRASKTQ